MEALKFAENSDAIIVRIYEGYGIDHKVKAQLFADIPASLGKVTICDLLENETEEEISFDKENKIVEFALKPYEIMTIKIQVEA